MSLFKQKKDNIGSTAQDVEAQNNEEGSLSGDKIILENDFNECGDMQEWFEILQRENLKPKFMKKFDQNYQYNSSQSLSINEFLEEENQDFIYSVLRKNEKINDQGSVEHCPQANAQKKEIDNDPFMKNSSQKKDNTQRLHSSQEIQSDPSNPPEQSNQKIQKLQIDVQLTQSEQHEFVQSLKKNGNLSKTIGRYLIQNFNHYQEYYLHLKSKDYCPFTAWKERFGELNEWVKSNKRNSINLKHFAEFFDDEGVEKGVKRVNRLVMRKILSKELRKKIIENNQVKKKTEYLIGAKVSALRCMNSGLTSRTQMK